MQNILNIFIIRFKDLRKLYSIVIHVVSPRGTKNTFFFTTRFWHTKNFALLTQLFRSFCVTKIIWDNVVPGSIFSRLPVSVFFCIHVCLFVMWFSNRGFLPSKYSTVQCTAGTVDVHIFRIGILRQLHLKFEIYKKSC